MVHYNLIVSMCKNNGIGMNGQMPWHIKNDLQYFSKMTKGDGHNAVIMGHHTWKSLPPVKGCLRGLAGRDNFVLTAEPSTFVHNNTASANSAPANHLIKAFASIQEIETFIKENEFYEDVWIIGGAQIYKTFFDKLTINKCYITYIDKEFECDTFFPDLDSNVWREVERNDTYDELYKCGVSYRVYIKDQNTDCH
jgi:dihydrofolate reductase